MIKTIILTLTLNFVILKITGVIAWPWHLVLLPFFVWAAFLAIMLLILGTLKGIVEALEKKKNG